MKKIYSKIFIYLLIFLFSFHQLSYALLTLPEEEEIGKQVLQELSSKIEFIQDVELVAYINSVGKILTEKGVDFSPFKFRFYLIKDDTFNAFSVPGGYIFLNSGIFESIESEEELAGIMAHEIAHNLCRHVAKRLESAKRMQIAITAATLAAILLGGDKAAEAVGITSSAFAEAKLLAYSRADEEEADRTGFQILTKAGYNPWGMVRIMEKLSKKSNFAVELNYKYLLTHPLPQERLTYLINLARKYGSDKGSSSIISSDPYYFKRLTIKAMVISKDPADLVLKYKEELKIKDDPWIRYSLALALSQQRFFKEAIYEMEKTLKELPPKPYFLLDLAEIYLDSGDYQRALTVIENIKFSEGSKNLFEKIVYLKTQYLKAKALAETSRLFQAYEIFNNLKGNNILENDPYFYFYFGRICSRINKDGEAHFYFGKYYELKGDYKTAYFHYKKALSFLSKKDKMYNEVEKSIKYMKKDK
ncbi:MAG: M48 family metalloprotease [Thermodesulfobacterium sp.]|nr:M48 family metalloprotease [Thermodesulfobacterium sp.]